MKVKIDKKYEDYQAIWLDEQCHINAIDQRKLPFTFEIYKAETVQETCYAIKEMVVRGAPLIGVTAAYGLVLAAKANENSSIKKMEKELHKAEKQLLKTRPTAVDLLNAVKTILNVFTPTKTPQENIETMKRKAVELAQQIINECQTIGVQGLKIIPKRQCKIMTICNAGALATVDIGTALAPIREAHKQGKKPIVYVNETRPRMQGARLTAWELFNENIQHYIITDNTAGSLIKEKKIDIVIVGADRIVLNGDVANKIGTYPLSLLCKEHNIPFYVAAPRSTFDETTKNGKDITIEERSSEEVAKALSINDKTDTNPRYRIIHHYQSPNINIAFDITPAKNITGIITPTKIIKQPLEKGIKEYLATVKK
ncbi:MAG: S-methyl-5-thioribose-1-phosphate isomerase [Asgard group archaeon]|nr:S-methyl-5-thioribose-1-phosphate isomerase [Asgard group archaeon]